MSPRQSTVLSGVRGGVGRGIIRRNLANMSPQGSSKNVHINIRTVSCIPLQGSTVGISDF